VKVAVEFISIFVVRTSVEKVPKKSGFIPKNAIFSAKGLNRPIFWRIFHKRKNCDFFEILPIKSRVDRKNRRENFFADKMPQMVITRFSFCDLVCAFFIAFAEPREQGFASCKRGEEPD